MRQTVAVGIIKSVDKTEKSGGKGKNSYVCPAKVSQPVHFSDEICGEGGQEEVIDVESSCIFSCLYLLHSARSFHRVMCAIRIITTHLYSQ